MPVSPDTTENTQSTKKKKPKVKAKKTLTWRNPQSWVPKEISFYFFLMPFIFWPILIILLVLNHYNQIVSQYSLETLKNFNPPTVSYIYSRDGQPIAELYKEHRLVVPLSEIPEVVIEAFISAEDSSFYRHHGIDFTGIARAGLANFQAGRNVQGASTITQQMIRTFFLSNEKTYERKIKEMLLSWRVENFLNKDEILYLYLNRIYLGRGAYGVESAARLYFGKNISDITLPEAAMLAGLVKAPSQLVPHLNTQKSKDRQSYVLHRMVVNGYISEQQAKVALDTPLNFIQHRPNLYREMAPQFTEVVRRQVLGIIGEEKLLNDGVKVYSTIDLNAQLMAEEALKNGLENLAKRQKLSPRVAHLTPEQAQEFNERTISNLESRPLLAGQEPAGLVKKIIDDGEDAGLEIFIGEEKGFIPAKSINWFTGKKKLSQVFAVNDLLMVNANEKNPETGIWDLTPAPPPDLQGAIVVIENKTGDVVALVGGRDFGLSEYGKADFNRAIQAKRQPGSTFKPFVYAAAIDNGYTQASIVYDSPVSYPDGSGKLWKPKNYGGKYSGAQTLYSALIKSTNVVAAKVGAEVGPEKVAEYAKKMGITSPLKPTLSLSLGASEVTLLELTSAYTSFPNGGAWAWPIFITKIEDRSGAEIVKYQPYLTQGISPETAYIILDMLQGVTSRGTASRVAGELKIPVGGKTGTSNSQADAWFVGFTPEYTCGVWVGRDVRITLGYGEQGGRTASPIFTSFMKKFMADKEPGSFAVPEGVIRQALQSIDENGETMGSGQTFVFKKGEIGRGRIDESNVVEEDADSGSSEIPINQLSQEEIDKRLMDYLKDYEKRKGGAI